MAGTAGLSSILTKAGNRGSSMTGLAMGMMQGAQAKKAKKKAQAATPSGTDPTQAAFLAELQQKKNALNTGAEYSSSLDAINDKLSQTQAAIGEFAGGDSAGAISGLLKAQQVANQGEGQLLAQGQQQEGIYSGIYGDLLNKMAQRKLELGLLSRAQNMAEWAQNKQSSTSNITGALNSFMDFKGGDKQQAIAQPGPTAMTSPMSSGGGMGSARQGVEGFNIGGGGKSVSSTPLNMGSSNPLGSMQANSARGQGINLSSLTSKANVTGGGGGGFDVSKLLSGFGK